VSEACISCDPVREPARLVTTSVTHPSCLPWQENEPKRTESTPGTRAVAADILPTGTGRIRHQSNGEACEPDRVFDQDRSWQVPVASALGEMHVATWVT